MAETKDKEVVCDICEDTGEIITRAYQNGGNIVDEDVSPCICTVDFDEDDDDGYYDDEDDEE